MVAFLDANRVNGVTTTEAMDFSRAAVEALMNGAEVDFVEQVIISASVPECVKNIINKIKADNVYIDLGDLPTFVREELNLSGEIMDVFNNSNLYHLNFKTEDLGSNKNASTSFNVTTKAFDITLNSNYISNGTDLAIARTIIHESTHAYISLIYYTQGFSDLRQSLDHLLIQNGNNMNSSQHILMTKQFIGGISNSLESWDNNSLSNNEYYKYLSWSGGMISTQAFNSLPLTFQQNAIQANINEGQANIIANSNAKGDKNCN